MQAVVSVTEGLQWGLMAPASLTPTGSIVALRERRLDRSIRFTTGLLAGKRLSISQIQAMKEESSGELLFMQPIFLAYGAHIIASGKKVSSPLVIGFRQSGNKASERFRLRLSLLLIAADAAAPQY